MILMIDEFLMILIDYKNLFLFKKPDLSVIASVLINDFLLLVLLTKVVITDDFND